MYEKVLSIIKSLLTWFILSIIVYISLIIYTGYIHNHFDEIAITFLSGFILSCIFYFLVAYLPSRKRRAIFKNYFKASYKEIKRNLIRLILDCSKKGGRKDLDITEELVDKLFDVKEFRALFKDGEQAKEGFYAFLNHIQSHNFDFLQIIQELKVLTKQLEFFIQNYDVARQEDLKWLKDLEIRLYNFNNIVEVEYDDVKSLGNFLYEVFAGVSLYGYIDYDPIEKMIEEIR